MLKAAIIDMYDGTPNLGMASIFRVFNEQFPDIEYEVYDIRGKQEVPSMQYDIYISTGGPGHPLEGNEAWEDEYYKLLDDIWYHNQKSDSKKFVFFICHSFQIACDHFGVGKITQRPQDSFGIFRVAKTEAGRTDRLFASLPDPFYAADFRSYQVIDADVVRLQELGIQILAQEYHKNHDFPHLALMAVRFSDTIYGVQFHPEAYPEGMLEYFQQESRKKVIIEQFGRAAYEEMIFHTKDPIKVSLTNKKVLPGFLEYATRSLTCTPITAR
ncbi:MAG: homoserine O-succinyltransferase [Saprospiraceae bacterium]|nr:homoserine O-succinyltransferase [Saprospiraceae bacterium]